MYINALKWKSPPLFYFGFRPSRLWGLIFAGLEVVAQRPLVHEIIRQVSILIQYQDNINTGLLTSES